MSWRRELSKLHRLFRLHKPVDDIEEEIRTHLQMEALENREAGMPPRGILLCRSKAFRQRDDSAGENQGDLEMAFC